MTNFKTNRAFLLTLVFTCLILSIFFLSISPSDTKSPELSVEIINVTEKYPGAFIRHLHPNPSNTTYCKFNHRMPYDLNLSQKNVDFGPEQGTNSSYRILYNVIEATISPGVPGITYATHVTADFVNYIPELVRLVFIYYII